MPDDSERLWRSQRFIAKSLLDQSGMVEIGLRQTQAHLMGLGAALVVKGVLTEAEWTTATAEIEATRAVEEAVDPRRELLERILNRISTGEEIPQDEFERLLREAMEQRDEEAG
jgi:hypothetical protein